MNCSMISGKDIVTTYLEMLSNDVWSFLTRKPEFAKGTIPYDGFTSGRDGVS